MTTKKIAIIGAGSIGTTIADEISNHLDEYYELVGIMKNSESRIKELEMTYKVPVVTECSKLLETKPDFIIEAAGVEVVKRSEEHTSELQSRGHIVCRLLLEKKK